MRRRDEKDSPDKDKDKERTKTMSKFKIGERVVTNGAAPLDNTKQLMPHLRGTVVGYDVDGKVKVKMDGEDEPWYISEHEIDRKTISKLKVRITRTEVYERVVEVEAESLDAAIDKAKENEQNNEYAFLFDAPDGVSTSFDAVPNDPATIENADGKYRLAELPAIELDSWTEGISAMCMIDKVYEEAHKMAGLEIDEDNPICPSEMEAEYTALADKYDFRFDSKGRIVSYDLKKADNEGR